METKDGKKDEAVKPTDTGATVPVVSADPVGAKLKGLGVADEVIVKIKELGAETEADLVGLTETDLTGAGMKPLKARALVANLKPMTPAAVGPTASRVAVVSTVRLQDVPQSQNWLSALCAIQPQRIQPVTVVTGVRAAMADVYGYFQLPRRMMKMLREAADSVGEGVPDLYFELQNLNQARRYGTLVAWMQGKGSACSVTERNRFLDRMQEKFWPAVDSFYGTLDGWRQGRKDSQDITEALANMGTGEIQIFDATVVRTAALALGDTINRTFSGTGVYAATALALDNDKLQKVLAEMDFRQLGVQSREQLLAQLKCAVPAEIAAGETAISRFIWNAMLVKDQAPGSAEEQKFLIELASIGTSRPWNQIKDLAAKRSRSNDRLSGIGSGRRGDQEDEAEEQDDEK